MKFGGIILALVVSLLAAWFVTGALKAFDQFGSDGANPFRAAQAASDLEATSRSWGGRAKSVSGFHNHNLLPVLRRFGEGAL